MSKADTRGPRESVYDYYMSQIFSAKESIQVMSGTDGRERHIRTLHQSICMGPDDPESTYRPGSHVRSKSNVGLNCFPLVASYCCDIRQGTVVSGI